jgi:hypothetical protein
MSPFFQQPDRNFLVDEIIFGQQNVERPRVSRREWTVTREGFSSDWFCAPSAMRIAARRSERLIGFDR